MRILPTLLKTSLLGAIIGTASLACADEIGRYTLVLNNQHATYISTFIADTGAGKTYSDLVKITLNNTEMIRVGAHTPYDEEQSEFPTISLTLSGNASGHNDLMFIQLKNIDRKTALTADSKLGQKHIKNFTLDAAGNIRFDFSADLVRTSLKKETAIDGAAGAHIEGHYSGKIPTRKMKE